MKKDYWEKKRNLALYMAFLKIVLLKVKLIKYIKHDFHIKITFLFAVSETCKFLF